MKATGYSTVFYLTICTFVLIISLAHAYVIKLEADNSLTLQDDEEAVVDANKKDDVVMDADNKDDAAMDADNYVTLHNKDKIVKNGLHIYRDETSVRHFAIHALCRHHKGKKYFYKVMKSKLCQVKAQFVADLVSDMCVQRNDGVYKEALFKWVRELFDIDDDGYISYFEKHLYEYDN